VCDIEDDVVALHMGKSNECCIFS